MAEEDRDGGEHTETQFPRRLEEAIRRGDVAKSPEVNTWFMIAGGALMIMLFAEPMATSLQATFRGLLAKSYQIPTDGPALAALMQKLAVTVGLCVRHPARAAGDCGSCRQCRSAPLGVFDRADQAATVADFAARRRCAAVLAAGICEFRQGRAKLLLVGAIMGALIWPQRHS